MGKNTLQSLPSQTLKNRKLFLLSRDQSISPYNIPVIHNYYDFSLLSLTNNQLWIIGGPTCISTIVQWGCFPDVIFWSQINGDYECDNMFDFIENLTTAYK